MGSSSKKIQKTLGDPHGVALVAALILMAIVGVMGASVLIATSTEITISGNFRRGIEAFYVAEAGVEEARARLRGSSFSTEGFIADPVPEYDPVWSAYVLTSTDWKTTEDGGYSEQSTNYIPLPSSPTNTPIVANSLQGALPFWVKIRHKTEYDAERNGHRFGSPHYLDGDGSLEKHTKAKPGHIIFYGYAAADSINPTQFTTTGTPEAFPAELVTAHGTLKGGSSVIEVEVVHHPGPRVLAALYARNGVLVTGTSSSINGFDYCGMLPSKAPVYSLVPSVTKGNAAFQGNPSSPAQGPLDIDIPSMISFLKKGASLLTADQIGVMLGSSSNPKTFYANIAGDLNFVTFTLQNGSGAGILLVEGPMQIRGPLNWQGLIVNSGTLTLDASTGPIQIRGGVWSDQIQHVAGNIDIHYDSCAIKNSLLSRPLTVTQWRQIM